MKRVLLLLLIACGEPIVPTLDDGGCPGHLVYDGVCTYVPDGPTMRFHFDAGEPDGGSP